MAGVQVRHKVSKSCWGNPTCRKKFIAQWEELGQVYQYYEPIATNPTHLWAVFRR